jgi:hypothetical protein
VVFDNADITLLASEEYSTANMTVENSSGVIGSLSIAASTVNANFNDFNGSVGQISVSSVGRSSSELSILDLQSNVNHIDLSATGSSLSNTYVTAEVGFAQGFVEQTDIFVNKGSESGSSSDMAVNLTVNGTYGGDVLVKGTDQTDGSTVNLTYLNGSASAIHLGNGDGDLFNFGSLNELTENQFNLTLSGSDYDYMLGEDNWETLIDNMLVISGSDMGTTDGNDTLAFNVQDDAQEFYLEMANFDNLASLLNAADSNLTGNTKFAFGTVEGSGYLAYDGDGDGISALVEFYGVTTFDAARLSAGGPVDIYTT